jgi:hypothetical protein
MAQASRAAAQPEPTSEPQTVAEVRDEIESGDATRLAMLHFDEQRRADGPRQSVLERIARQRRAADEELRDNGSGIDVSEADHYARLWGVDYSIMSATFQYLGRTRVAEDELRRAVGHVGRREV